MWGRFVLTYPNKGRLDEAAPLWFELSEDDQRYALAVAQEQAAKPGWQRDAGRWVPSADKWLRRRDFEKYPNPLARAVADSAPPPPPLSDEDRAAGQARLAELKRGARAGRPVIEVGAAP